MGRTVGPSTTSSTTSSTASVASLATTDSGTTPAGIPSLGTGIVPPIGGVTAVSGTTDVGLGVVDELGVPSSKSSMNEAVPLVGLVTVPAAGSPASTDSTSSNAATKLSQVSVLASAKSS